MRKILVVLFMFPLGAFSQNSDAMYTTIEATNMYELSEPYGYIVTIPKGTFLKALSSSDRITIVEYRGKRGFVQTEEITKAPEHSVRQSRSGDYAETKELPDLLNNLVVYTKAHRASLNTFYISATIALGCAIPPIVWSSKDSDWEHPKSVKSLGALSLTAGAVALVAGICIYETQRQINKSNANLQLKANGFSVVF